MKWQIREHKATMFMAAGAIFYAGWICSAAHFDLKQRWVEQHRLVQVETKIVPKLKTDLKQANCDKDRYAGVAAQGIAADQISGVQAPGWDDLKGCAKVSPVKPPPVSAIVR